MYEGAPSPVTGYLASIAKAAGFAALARVLYVAVFQQGTAWSPIIVALAFASLSVGAVMAICQSDVKRMLAFSSISHAGFVLVGLAAIDPDIVDRLWANFGGSVGAAADLGDGVSSAVFYLVVYSFMALGSFAVLSAVVGSSTDPDDGTSRHDLSRYSGLARRRPVLALAFAVLLLAQAGVPLTAGFVAKFEVIHAAIDEGVYVLAAVAMVTAVVSAFAYLRVVLAMYAPEGAAVADDDAPTARVSRPRWGDLPLTTVLAIALAVAVTLVVGVLPQTLLEWSADAALSIFP